MKTTIVMLALVALPMFGQVQATDPVTVGDRTEYASLGSAASYAGRWRTVTDCNSSDNCTAGGGTADVPFWSDGSAWRQGGISSWQITLAVGSSDIGSTGTKACGLVARAGTIVAATLTANALPTGADLVVDVLTVAYASYTGYASASSITASATPIIDTGDANPKYTDSTLTGWTTAIAANTMVCVAVDSAPTGGATSAQLVLTMR